MENCIFCKIVAGTVSNEKVYETNDFLVFMDVNPRAPGHVLVIPKKHYRYVWDVPNAGEYFEVAKKIALAQQKAFGVEGVWSRVTGEEVPHAHIWLIPDPRATPGDKKDFKGNAEKIRKFL